jgi:iron complex transport system substrate-binding protein
LSEYWPLEDGYTGLEEGTGGANEALFDLAPVVGVTQGPSVATMIDDYSVLAESLGADLDAPAIVSERERFEAAVERFKAVVASKPDLSVLAVSPTAEALYVAVPAGAAELSDFVSWGLNIIEPVPDPAFPYWETLSWENAAKYQADLIIYDDRTGTTGLEQAEAQPTWSLLAAVDAGAVTTWPAFWLRNYSAYADQLDHLTDVIETTDEHLVD